MPFSKGKGKIYDFSKFTIWVIRLSNTGQLKDAMPCKRCCVALKNLGFKNVAFSNIDGNIEMVNIQKFQNDHLSSSQIKTEKYSRINFKSAIF